MLLSLFFGTSLIIDLQYILLEHLGYVFWSWAHAFLAVLALPTSGTVCHWRLLRPPRSMSRHRFFAHAELIKEGLGNTKIETYGGSNGRTGGLLQLMCCLVSGARVVVQPVEWWFLALKMGKRFWVNPWIGTTGQLNLSLQMQICGYIRQGPDLIFEKDDGLPCGDKYLQY